MERSHDNFHLCMYCTISLRMASSENSVAGNTYPSGDFCCPLVEVPHCYAHNDWSSYECERYHDVCEGNYKWVVSLPVIAIHPKVEGHPSKGQDRWAHCHHNAATVTRIVTFMELLKCPVTHTQYTAILMKQIAADRSNVPVRGYSLKTAIGQFIATHLSARSPSTQ